MWARHLMDEAFQSKKDQKGGWRKKNKIQERSRQTPQAICNAPHSPECFPDNQPPGGTFVSVLLLVGTVGAALDHCDEGPGGCERRGRPFPHIPAHPAELAQPAQGSRAYILYMGLGGGLG